MPLREDGNDVVTYLRYVTRNQFRYGKLKVNTLFSVSLTSIDIRTEKTQNSLVHNYMST